MFSNDDRQLAVNKIAEEYGSSTGTADIYGVPGTRQNTGGYEGKSIHN